MGIFYNLVEFVYYLMVLVLFGCLFVIVILGGMFVVLFYVFLIMSVVKSDIVCMVGVNNLVNVGCMVIGILFVVGFSVIGVLVID